MTLLELRDALRKATGPEGDARSGWTLTCPEWLAMDKGLL